MAAAAVTLCYTDDATIKAHLRDLGLRAKVEHHGGYGGGRMIYLEHPALRYAIIWALLELFGGCMLADRVPYFREHFALPVVIIIVASLAPALFFNRFNAQLSDDEGGGWHLQIRTRNMIPRAEALGAALYEKTGRAVRIVCLEAPRTA